MILSTDIRLVQSLNPQEGNLIKSGYHIVPNPSTILEITYFLTAFLSVFHLLSDYTCKCITLLESAGWDQDQDQNEAYTQWLYLK
jgi:hypothetical protein